MVLLGQARSPWSFSALSPTEHALQSIEKCTCVQRIPGETNKDAIWIGSSASAKRWGTTFEEKVATQIDLAKLHMLWAVMFALSFLEWVLSPWVRIRAQITWRGVQKMEGWLAASKECGFSFRDSRLRISSTAPGSADLHLWISSGWLEYQTALISKMCLFLEKEKNTDQFSWSSYIQMFACPRVHPLHAKKIRFKLHIVLGNHP